MLLYQVCDNSGCIDYTNPSRRVTSTGVTVEYEIQAEAAAVGAIESAVGSASFADDFQKEMIKEGYDEIQWLDKPLLLTTTPAPVAAEETVPEDTIHYVTLTVTMPYTKAQFDDSKKAQYKVCACQCNFTHVLGMPFLPQMRVLPSCSPLGFCDKVSSCGLRCALYSRLPWPLQRALLQATWTSCR